MQSTRPFLLAAFLLPALAPAQTVPYGQGIVSVRANVAPSQGLWLFDRVTGATPITGLLAAGSPGIAVNALRMDPVDARIWLGGISPGVAGDGATTAGQVSWIVLNGTSVAFWQLQATLPITPAASINAIEFDDNGNVLVAAGTANAGGGLFRIDRRIAGLVTPIGAAGTTALHNALTKDADGNLYVGMWGSGELHRLTKNTDGTFQAPVLFATLPEIYLFGLAFAPAVGTEPAGIWVTTQGDSGQTLYRVPLTGGAPVGTNSGMGICNWIEYDRRADDLLVCHVSGDQVRRVDRATGTATVLGALQGGNVGAQTCLDLNDARNDDLVVLPMHPTAGVAFDLELGVTAPPGRLAFVGTLLPTPTVLAFGITGPDGRLAVTVPNVTLPPGVPAGSLLLAAGSLDLSTLAVTIGTPVAWPAN